MRREVSSQGRSRAFVDGALVTSAALRDAAGALVDLHGQHEHQVLLDPAAHLDLLDEFSGLTGSRDAVAAAFRTWQQVRDERARLAASEQQKSSRAEFLAFQLAEIDKAAPQAGEDEELDDDAAGAGECGPFATAVRGGLHGTVRRRQRGAAGARRDVEARWRTRRPGSEVRAVSGGAATASSRSSRTSPSFYGRIRRASTPRRRGCRRSRIGSRCSSV